MNANEAVSKIRVLLGLNENTFTFATATLVDGTEVKTEGELVEGASLMVVTPEGEVSAPAGVHETSTGLLITVDENGSIVKIEESVAEATEEETKEEVEMEEVEVVVPEEVAPVLTEEVVQAVVEALAPVVEEVAQIAEELKKMKAQFQAFKAEPAAKPVKRNDFSAERASAVDRILQIRKQK